jgi:hypothetical protein
MEPRRYGSRQSAGQSCRVSPSESAVRTIQFNLGENGIENSKAKSIKTAMAEADADLFDSRELWARGSASDFTCHDGPLSMPLERSHLQRQQDQKALTQDALGEV